MGGLSIRSTFGTPKAPLLRQIWNTVINKPTCWNIWVKAKYLREETIWNVAIPNDASWGWKGILKIRPPALPCIKSLIGNDQLTKFWIDPWLNGGRLKDQYGDRTIYDLGMGANVLIQNFIINDD